MTKRIKPILETHKKTTKFKITYLDPISQWAVFVYDSKKRNYKFLEYKFETPEKAAEYAKKYKVETHDQ